MPHLPASSRSRTYSVNALRAGMPDTYFCTLGTEDVSRFRRENSPADRLGRGGPG